MIRENNILSYHLSPITALIQFRLQFSQGFGGLRVAGFLFEGEAVVARGFEQATALFVDAPKIHVREGVRFVARRKECALEPFD